MRIINAKRINTEDDVYIVAYLGEGRWKKVVPKISPFFFVRQKDLLDVKTTIDMEEYDYEIEKGDFVSADGKFEPLVKLYFPNTIKLLNARTALETKGIITYEANIKFARVWRLNEHIDIKDDPSRLWFDVEADSRLGIDPYDPKGRLLTIVGVTENSEYVIASESEKDTILDFAKLIKKFDILLGWNISGYDLPIIHARAKMNGIRFSFYPLAVFDVQKILIKEFYMKEPKDSSLEYWAQKLLGRGKLFKKITPEMIWSLWKNNRQKLIKYNRIDSELTRDIDLEYHISEYRIMLASSSRSTYVETGSYEYKRDKQTKKELSEMKPIGGRSKVVENAVLMETIRREKEGMTRPCFLTNPPGKTKKPEGALILEPVPGIYKWVLYLDLKSLYPSIVRTFNIGVDTIVDSSLEDKFLIQTTEHARFRKDVESVFRSTVIKYLEWRDRVKKKMKQLDPSSPEYSRLYATQYALKVVANSLIGNFGFERGMFLNTDVFESVTKTGKWIIMNIADITRSIGYRAIYSDTDSVFIHYGKKPKQEEIEAIIETINTKMHERMEKTFNIPPEKNYIYLKVDDIFEVIHFTKAKKMYVGYPIHNKKPNPLDHKEYIIGGRLAIVVGHQLKRRSTFPLLAKAEQKLFELLLRSALDSSVDYMVELKHYLRRMKSLMFSGKLDKLLVFTYGVRKDMDKYEVDQPHVKAAKKLAKIRTIRKGDTVKFVVVGYDKDGNLDAEPVIDGKIPTIRSAGYRYYFYDRILSRLEELLGKKINVDSGDLLEFFGR